MEENQNTSIPKQNFSQQNQSLSIDFETETMDDLIKNVPAQKETILLRPEKELEQKKEPSKITKMEAKEKSPALIQRIDKPAENIKDSLNKFPAPNPKQLESDKKNNQLFIILSILLLISLLGGVFYYFRYFKPKKDVSVSKQPIAIPKTEIETITPNINPEKEKTPSFSLQTEELLLINENLSEKLLSIKQAAVDNPALRETLIDGLFYQVKKNNSLLSAQELLQAMDIALPIEATTSMKDGWIFVYLDQNSNLKTALVFDVNQENYNNAMFLNLEKEMPLLFKNLFIDEDSSFSQKDIIFQTSQEDARLRFFNFIKEDNTRTIDWAKVNQYLFFTTSKETALKLIPLLEK